MKNNKILLLLSIVLFAFSSCSDLSEYNEDTKNPAVATPEGLFSNAVKNLVDQQVDINVNRNVFKLYAQYVAQTTYPQESQYQMVTRNIPRNYWSALYKDVLRDLDESRKLLEAVEGGTAAQKIDRKNQLAMIEIVSVYTWATLVDIFGDVPYSEALDINNVLPKYDDAQTIYNNLFTRIETAIKSLDVSGNGFGNNDFFYAGNVDQWNLFGNSVMLSMAMRVADADDATAKKYAKLAFDGGLILENSDNAVIDYLKGAGTTNPVWQALVESGRSDYVGANTLIDMMNGLNDPRIAEFYQEKADTNAYIGGVYGDANGFASYSHLSTKLHKATFPGTILTASEIHFALAEAVERGYDVSGSAAGHYKAGIMASFDEWGATGFADYYIQSDVDYSTATGDWKQKIGTQKWIAYFNRGFEGWTEWRRLDFPILNVPPGLTYGDIPTRFIYPVEEATLNGTNRDAAAAKYDGDSPTAKIFWDKF